MNRSVIMLVLVCLLIGTGTTVLAEPEAESTDVDWTPDVARKLVSMDWGVAEQKGKPTVVYTLSLVQFGSDVLDTRKAGFAVTNDEDSESELEILPGEFAVSLLGDLPFGVSMAVDGEKTWSRKGTSLDSWLVTVEGQPVAAEFRERTLSLKSESESDRVLKVVLIPEQIDDARQRVLTGLDLEYISANGMISRARFDDWVTNGTEVPAAVLVHTKYLDEGIIRSFFALYVSAVAMLPDDIPSAPVVQIGALDGLKRWFWSEGEGSWKNGMEAYLGGLSARGQLSMASGVSVEFDGGNRFRADVVFGRNLYEVLLRADVAMVDGLCLTGNFEKREEAILRMGLSDRVRLGDWQLGASLFPVQCGLTSSRIHYHLSWDVNALWEKNGWSIGAQLAEGLQGLSYGALLAKQIGKGLGVWVSWTRIDGDERVMVVITRSTW